MDNNLENNNNNLSEFYKSNCIMFKHLSEALKEGNNLKIMSILTSEYFEKKLDNLLLYYKELSLDNSNQDNINSIINTNFQQTKITEGSYLFSNILNTSASLNLPYSITLQVLEAYYINNKKEFEIIKSVDATLSTNFNSRRTEFLEKLHKFKKEKLRLILDFYIQERNYLLKIFKLLISILYNDYFIVQNKFNLSLSNNVYEKIKDILSKNYVKILFDQIDKIKENTNLKIEKNNKSQLYTSNNIIEDKDFIIVNANNEIYSSLCLINSFSNIIFMLKLKNEANIHYENLIRLLNIIDNKNYFLISNAYLNDYHDKSNYEMFKDNIKNISIVLDYLQLSLFGITNLSLTSVENIPDFKNLMPYSMLQKKENFDNLLLIITNNKNENNCYLWENEKKQTLVYAIIVTIDFCINNKNLFKNLNIENTLNNIDLDNLKKNFPDIPRTEVMIKLLIHKKNELTYNANNFLCNELIAISTALVSLNKSNIKICYKDVSNVFKDCFNNENTTLNYNILNFPVIKNIISYLFDKFPYDIEYGVDFLFKIKNQNKNFLFKVLNNINTINVLINKEYIALKDNNNISDNYRLIEDINIFFITISKEEPIELKDEIGNNKVFIAKNEFKIWYYIKEIWTYCIANIYEKELLCHANSYNKNSADSFAFKQSDLKIKSKHNLDNCDLNNVDTIALSKLIGIFTYTLEHENIFKEWLNLNINSEVSNILSELKKSELIDNSEHDDQIFLKKEASIRLCRELINYNIKTIQSLTIVKEIYFNYVEVVNSMLLFLNFLLTNVNANTNLKYFTDIIFTGKLDLTIMKGNLNCQFMSESPLILDIFIKILNYDIEYSNVNTNSNSDNNILNKLMIYTDSLYNYCNTIQVYNIISGILNDQNILINFLKYDLDNSLFLIKEISNIFLTNYTKEFLLKEKSFLFNYNNLLIVDNILKIINSFLNLLSFNCVNNIMVLENVDNNKLEEAIVSLLNNFNFFELIIEITKVTPVHVYNSKDNLDKSNYNLISFYINYYIDANKVFMINNGYEIMFDNLIYCSLKTLDNIIALSLLTNYYKLKCNSNSDIFDNRIEIICQLNCLNIMNMMTKSLYEMPSINVSYNDNIYNTHESAKINLFHILFSYTDNFKKLRSFDNSMFTFYNNLNKKILSDENISGSCFEIEKKIYIISNYHSYNYFSISELSYNCLCKLFLLLNYNKNFKKNSVKEFLFFKKDNDNIYSFNYLDNIRDFIFENLSILKNLSAKDEYIYIFKIINQLLQFLAIVSEVQPFFFAQLITVENKSNNNNTTLSYIIIESYKNNYKVLKKFLKDCDTNLLNNIPVYNIVSEIHTSFILLFSSMIRNYLFIKHINSEIFRDKDIIESLFESIDYYDTSLCIKNKMISEYCVLFTEDQEYFKKLYFNIDNKSEGIKSKYISNISHKNNKIIIIKALCDIINSLQVIFISTEVSDYFNGNNSHILTLLSKFISFFSNVFKSYTEIDFSYLYKNISIINEKFTNVSSNNRLDYSYQNTDIKESQYIVNENYNKNSIYISSHSYLVTNEYNFDNNINNVELLASMFDNFSNYNSNDILFAFDIKTIINKMIVNKYDINLYSNDIGYLMLVNIQIKNYYLLNLALNSGKYLIGNLLNVGFNNISYSMFYYTKPYINDTINNESNNKTDISTKFTSTFLISLMNLTENMKFQNVQFGLISMFCKNSKIYDILSNYLINSNNFNINFNVFDTYESNKIKFIDLLSIIFNFMTLINNSKYNFISDNYSNNKILNLDVLCMTNENLIKFSIDQLASILNIFEFIIDDKYVKYTNDLKLSVLSILNLLSSIVIFIISFFKEKILTNNFIYGIESNVATSDVRTDIFKINCNEKISSKIINILDNVLQKLNFIFNKYPIYNSIISFTTTSIVNLNYILLDNIENCLLFKEKNNSSGLFNSLLNHFMSKVCTKQYYSSILQILSVLLDNYKENVLNYLLNFKIFDYLTGNDTNLNINSENIIEYDSNYRNVEHIIWCGKLHLLNNFLETGIAHNKYFNDIANTNTTINRSINTTNCLKYLVKCIFNFISINKQRVFSLINNFVLSENPAHFSVKSLASLEELCEILRLIRNLSTIQDELFLDNSLSIYLNLYISMYQGIMCNLIK